MRNGENQLHTVMRLIDKYRKSDHNSAVNTESAMVLRDRVLHGRNLCYECGCELEDGEWGVALGRYLYCLDCVRENLIEL